MPCPKGKMCTSLGLYNVVEAANCPEGVICKYGG